MLTATPELVLNKDWVNSQKALQVLQSLQFNELKRTSSAQTGRENIKQEIQQWQNNTVSAALLL